jgi:hypothetical protein
VTKPPALAADPLYRLRRLQRWSRDALAVGAFLTCALVPLSRIGGDQLDLLARGWLWAARGELVPYGTPLSIGGNGPGPLTSWLVGLPLLIWRDFRAPIALVALAHLVALVLLDRTVRDVVSPLERAAFLLLYGLAPWRVEASATLSAARYLFLVGAIDLATARRLASAPRFGATLAHVASLGLGAQLHPSVLLLGVHSLLLLYRRRLRFSWLGFIVGVALVAATLAPWLEAIQTDPELLPGASGFPFRALVLVFPLLKGLLLWLRYPTTFVSHETRRFDFSERLGPEIDRWLAPSAGALFLALTVATVVIALAANVLFFRGRWRVLLARQSGAVEPRAWLESYVAWAVVAAALVFAAAPSTPQGWQGIPLVHSSIFPLAFGAMRLIGRYGEPVARRALLACAGTFLVANLAIAAGAPSFRCSGRGTLVVPLRAHSPMFEELGIQRTCPWPLGVPGGWWPDVLPKE